MANRVKIGDWILDASGSTSTTPGTVLMWPEEGLRIRELAEAAEFTFFVRYDGNSRAQIETRLTQLRDTLKRLQGDVAIEVASGTSVAEFKTSDGSYTALAFDTEILPGERHGLMIVTARITRDAESRPNPALPDGAVDVFGWQYEQGPDGLAAAFARFGFQTHAQALTYAATIRSGTALPAFIPSSFKLQSIGYDIEEPETDEFRPSTIAVTLKQLPAWATGVDSDIVGITATLQAEPIRLNARAGSDATDPGLAFQVGGSITFKTEQNTSFDASDTSVVAGNQLRIKADAALVAIMDEAASRLGLGGEYITVERAFPSLEVERGTVNFNVVAMSGNPGRVQAYDETITSILTDRDVEVYDGDGTETTFEHAAGYEWLVTFTATVASVGGSRPIQTPVVRSRLPAPGVTSADWKLKEWRPDFEVVENVSDPGLALHVRSLSATWKYRKQNRENRQVRGTLAVRWG